MKKNLSVKIYGSNVLFLFKNKWIRPPCEIICNEQDFDSLKVQCIKNGLSFEIIEEKPDLDFFYLESLSEDSEISINSEPTIEEKSILSELTINNEESTLKKILRTGNIDFVKEGE